MEAVIRVVPRNDFSLELWFDTGDHRLFYASPYLDRGCFYSAAGYCFVQAGIRRFGYRVLAGRSGYCP